MTKKIVLEVVPLLYRYHHSQLGEMAEKLLKKEGIHYNITTFSQIPTVSLKQGLELKTHLGNFCGLDGIALFIQKVK